MRIGIGAHREVKIFGLNLNPPILSRLNISYQQIEKNYLGKYFFNRSQKTNQFCLKANQWHHPDVKESL